MADEPTPAETLYAPSKEIEGHKKMLHKALEIGMQSLGFGGGAMGIVKEIVDTFDHDKLLSPMRRIDELRQSPDYKGNKPTGNSKEETERLRTERWKEYDKTLLNME